MKFNIFKNSWLALSALAVTLTGCSPDEVTGGNPISNPNVDASFTVSADASGNHITATGVTQGVIVHRWDIGAGQFKGSSAEDFFFPDAGTYTITHTVYGSGGSSNTSTQTITVDTPDPIAGNLILGGKFETPDDHSKWTVLNISNNGAFTFGEGSATVTGGLGSNAHKAIYQAVEVEAGHEYKLDMKVWGPGSTDTWFEVYVNAQAPVQNSDYSAGGKKLQLNTWAGCATAPFEGMLSVVGCGGDSQGPVVEFTQSGTVYFVIKGGCTGDNGAINSISLTNVEFRRIN
ncbi:PKD domain-containing protein [Flavobacterium akiainvivens]|uniref:PKD domain-containing protein n=1 Tax=Flavobacterium akiainvivens TaxID=1202724 RepID=UPI0006C842C8|nr:PKD domain-containing protein [Flavobacterium akiainvivens]SFQ54023.1 hypothetical protein SAMN05444144_10791 [Flavobacterium akiainvivens]